VVVERAETQRLVRHLIPNSPWSQLENLSLSLIILIARLKIPSHAPRLGDCDFIITSQVPESQLEITHPLKCSAAGAA
jgi:hypothetical protein